jgi:predicted lipoprotein with Yx(FWY)xxD motif
MTRIRSSKATYGILLVALSSLAVAACGGGDSTTADSGYANATTASKKVSIGTGVHVTNTPTKKFRVKPVDATKSVALGPAGYPVYTFQGEPPTTSFARKGQARKPNCWGFWPPVSVHSSDDISKESRIGGKLGTFSNRGVRQLTLNGQPLYYFSPDLASKNPTQATGDQIKTFGSIWHIVATG